MPAINSTPFLKFKNGDLVRGRNIVSDHGVFCGRVSLGVVDNDFGPSSIIVLEVNKAEAPEHAMLIPRPGMRFLLYSKEGVPNYSYVGRDPALLAKARELREAVFPKGAT
jgi:hypothetical protein